jgi:uncharacterized protein YeaO (DUF488 family)
MVIQSKRAFDPVGDDGLRILVDRTWPRGVKKESLALGLWDRSLAASKEICVALENGSLGWKGFADAYRREIEESGAGQRLRALLTERCPTKITLLTATRFKEPNHVTALTEFLHENLGSGEPASR